MENKAVKHAVVLLNCTVKATNIFVLSLKHKMSTSTDIIFNKFMSACFFLLFFLNNTSSAEDEFKVEMEVKVYF